MGDWFQESFRAEYERQAEILGRFNLALFGKTGVGKSTLVNAIFGQDVARTGIGEPVTKGSHLYLDTYGQLGIVDTQGLEVGKDDKAIVAELNALMKSSRKKPLSEQVHVAWFCLRGLDRRFEQAEADFIERLHGLALPVLVVLTQVPLRDGHYHPDAVELADRITERRLPIVSGRPYLTNALADPFTGTPVHGLQEVLDATFRVAPDGVHAALAAAQQIDTKRKAAEARKAVTAAAGAAAAAAASPIPFSDAAMLVPIQLGMMARIAQLYGIRFNRAALLALASTTAATTVGRSTFTSLLKLVPGAGTVAGGAIGAGVASTFTFAMGQSWSSVCERVAARRQGGDASIVDNQELQRMFHEEFRRRLGRVRQQA